VAVVNAKPWVPQLARARSGSGAWQGGSLAAGLGTAPSSRHSPGAAPPCWAGIPPLDSFASAPHTKRGAQERQAILCQNSFFETQPGSAKRQPGLALGWAFGRGAPMSEQPRFSHLGR